MRACAASPLSSPLAIRCVASTSATFNHRLKAFAGFACRPSVPGYRLCVGLRMGAGEAVNIALREARAAMLTSAQVMQRAHML